ncbi:hypothetical protein FRC12_020566 [Ceratobasidium sp. 428]|nr:hypothetical protein FRC12_020566 [Ceratobasidium sp. 428]
MSNVRNGRTNAQLLAAGLKECTICKFCWNINGFTRHYNSCKSRSENRQRALKRPVAESNQALNATSSSSHRQAQHPTPIFSQQITSLLETCSTSVNEARVADQLGHNSSNDPHATDGDLELNAEQPGELQGTSQQLEAHNNSPEEGDIRVLRHPRPNRCVDQLAGNLLRRQQQSLPVFLHGKLAPWAPFRSQIHHLSPSSSVSFKNNRELQIFQDRAATQLSMFDSVQYSANYQKGRDTFCTEHIVLIRSLKEWFLELVLDPQLQQHLHFDAEQKFRFSGDKWVRFIDEPWTAENWAKTQASLPSDGLPINIHLYADKATTSSSGTKKLYPVVARLGNLPQEIRNGKGAGGGQVVALLPVISEEDLPKGLSDTSAADYRCAVWHGAVQKLLDTIRLEAFAGYAVELECHRALGLEKTLWRLFPSISIVSADYEEQVIVVCHRGSGCLCPCIRCLVPGDQLHNLLLRIRLRTPGDFLDKISRIDGLGITAARGLLKSHGYRPVQNAFMSLGPRTNIFEALSYDTLHCDDLGRWGKHLWVLLKDQLAEEPTEIQSRFEERIDAVPPWPNLEHFQRAQSVDFGDGSKYQDLLRVVLHGCIELPESFVPLVQLVRIQAELRALSSFEVHTEDTLALGKDLVKRFHKSSQECTSRYGKSFDFPKMHLLVHLFDDILNKGVAANFSTKPG